MITTLKRKTKQVFVNIEKEWHGGMTNWETTSNFFAPTVITGGLAGIVLLFNYVVNGLSPVTIEGIRFLHIVVVVPVILAAITVWVTKPLPEPKKKNDNPFVN